MNMYSNPLLKHVKKIRSICGVYGMSNADKLMGILDQCNLLLETKKAKKRKCEHYWSTLEGYTWCRTCGIAKPYQPLPDPKEERGKIEPLTEVINWPTSERLTRVEDKIREIIDYLKAL